MMTLPTNRFRTLSSTTAAILVSMLTLNPASTSADDHGLLSDFDLSSYGGAETGVLEVVPSEMETNFGTVAIDQSVYRVFDMSVPVWVDGAVTFAR